MNKIVLTEAQKKLLGLDDLIFNEDNIRCIFGHEAAEDEDLDRLKKYYLKTNIYDSMKSNVPLLILVGHKGVGKSALFKVLYTEEEEKGNISITVQPNDIAGLDIKNDNFLQKIELWKNGLSTIIFRKLILSISPTSKNTLRWVDSLSEITLTLLGKKVQDLQNEYVNLTSAQFVQLFRNIIFSEKRITIYLDDLDRGWENTKEDVKNLSAMINAIRDLSRDIHNLKFRIALRSDVYYAVRTSDETTDKIDGSVLWQSWTNHEILVMLVKRIETFFGRTIDEEALLHESQCDIGHYLDSVFETRYQGYGKWENAPMYRVLMSLIRKRPRDLVKLCTLSARRAYANKHHLILTNDLGSTFNNYSSDRLTDTSTEYKSELPQLNELLLKMKPTRKEVVGGSPYLFPRDQLLKKLEDILSMSRFYFKDDKEVTPQTLAAYLYKINFLTARKDTPTGIVRLYYDENQYIYNDFTDFGYSYEVHPAYRWALQPNSTDDLLKEILSVKDDG